MRLRITVSLDLDADQIKNLVALANHTGHGFGGVTAPCRLIRRYLEDRVTNAVAYAHEHAAGLFEDEDAGAK